MNFEAVKKIADAVLYEGYILYPYRASAVKNRQRFNFGTIYPQIYSELSSGSEPWKMRTECLVTGRRPQFEVRVRYLHLRAREVWRLTPSAGECANGGELPHEVVDSLRIGDQTFSSWQEATERELISPGLDSGMMGSGMLDEPQRQPFSFAAGEEREPLRDATSEPVALLVRRQSAIHGAIEIACQPLGPQLFKLNVTIENHTSFDAASASSRDDVLLRSFVSAHTVLGVNDGEFVSLLDPPAEFREAASGCQNLGTWPVLAGDEGQRNMLLSSPIILYDYPQVAPESSGDFFDGTEIDEMLALRIMTLTPDEQREMRDVDVRARQILDRVENLPPEHLMKLHGAVRGLKSSRR
jgi:hydrogenase maturation protease